MSEVMQNDKGIDPAKPYRWTKKGALAAQLVAEGDLSGEAIATKVEWGTATLSRHKGRPEFQARVAAIVAETTEALKARGIAERQARIDDHNDLHNRMRRIIEERAADPDWQHVPGWKSGLLVRTVKVVGYGESASFVNSFEVDAGLIAAINANKKQIAIELGQWAEKRELTGKDGGPVSFIELMATLGAN